MSTAKRNAMSVDIFGTTVTVTFSNGEDLALDVSTLTPELQRMAMLHGIKQKLVDAGAIARNTSTGQSASVDDKYKAVLEVYMRLKAGESWNKERGNGGEKPTKGKDLLPLAIMEMTGKDRSYVDQFLSSKTKAEREALKKNPRVLEAMAKLQASTVSNGVDTDALLGELGVGIEPESGDSDDDTTALELENEPKTIAQQVQEAIQKPKRTRKAATV